jgi:hypothetical protein
MEWKAELERERRRRGLEAPRAAELADTAEQHVIRDRGIREAGPYVRQVRRDVFGHPDPPWKPTQYKKAVRWIRERLNSEKDSTGGVSGKTVLRLGPDTFTVPRGSSLYPLAMAVERIANATGFPAVHVAGWILSGEEPDLPRVTIAVQDQAAQLGDRFLSRRSVSLNFNTPIREADFRRLFRQVRAAFDQGADFDFRAGRGRKGPVITILDRHLADIMERLPDATWQERADVWSSEPPPGTRQQEWRTSRHALASPDALRVRWQRYERKQAKITQPED